MIQLYTAPSLLAVLVSLSAGAAQAASVAVNFQHGDFGDNTGIQTTETAMGIPGAEWTNLSIEGTGGAASGTGTAAGLTVAWHSANSWSAGSEGVLGNDASQQVFRSYLDDGDGGTSYFPTDGFGVSVQVSGITALLGANNATSFALTLYFSTDSSNFTTARIFSGLPPVVSTATGISSLPELGTIAAATPLGNGTFPIPAGAGTDTGGARGVGSLSGLTADSITIALPSNAGGGIRGSLAGFSITPVPEPSVTLMLGGLSLAGLLRRRRPH